jgi:NADH-quinone oxidoreductase subunit L
LLELVWLVPTLPLLGFVLIVFFGKRLGEPLAGILATVLTFASFGVGLAVFAGLLNRPESQRVYEQVLFTWIPAGRFHVDVGFYVDPLSVTWLLLVTGVGALIHLYSIGYMHGDERFHTFFAYMNLFIFTMLMLVLGDNFLITFLGWEGVGACSYFLISFWFEKRENATAGKKAFVTNRIGDWGFLVAMFLTFFTFGSLNYAKVLPLAPGLAATTATALGALFFVAAVGKSAQLPLFVWLPDAMAGPTPVSALIHAATMVTAGVYLMVRINPILSASYSELGTAIMWIGTITAFVAGTAAVSQNDIKKVLAYSTVSQLGFMFIAVGAGAYVAAVFHVLTHAFFKGLLFLAAGSVIHGMHDEQDMRRMGGLSKPMPITNATFLVAAIALAGIPPLAGFWSKDDILLSEFATNHLAWFVGLAAALLTAFYIARQYLLVFHTKKRWEPGVHPHESGPIMTVPLVVLAIGAAIGGFMNMPFNRDTKVLDKWLAPSIPFETKITVDTGVKIELVVLAIITAVVGVVVAWVLYQRRRIPADALEPAVLGRAWYVDWAYSWFVAGPGTALFLAASWFDRTVIDGAVNGAGVLVRGTGDGVRRLQNGLVRSYALIVSIGVVALLAFVLLRMTY